MRNLFNTLSENSQIVLINSLLVACLGTLGFFGKMLFDLEKKRSTSPTPSSITLQYNPNSTIIMHSGSGSINTGINLEQQYEQKIE